VKVIDGQLLYVFLATNDPWIDELREIFMGPVGWDPEDFDTAWVEDASGFDFARPSMFAQLMTVYRYLGKTPQEAVDLLKEHPDYRYLAESV
jgi:hypothetical protein